MCRLDALLVDHVHQVSYRFIVRLAIARTVSAVLRGSEIKPKDVSTANRIFMAVLLAVRYIAPRV